MTLQHLIEQNDTSVISQLEKTLHMQNTMILQEKTLIFSSLQTTGCPQEAIEQTNTANNGHMPELLVLVMEYMEMFAAFNLAKTCLMSLDRELSKFLDSQLWEIQLRVET